MTPLWTCIRRTGLGHRDPGLHQVRRAGRVGDHAARPDGPQRRAEQLALQPGQRRQVGRLAPPARLRPATQRAEPGAGASTSTRSKPPTGSASSTPTSRPSAQTTSTGSPAPPARPGRARCGATSTAVTRAPRCAASAPSNDRLAARARAQRSSQRSSRPATGALAKADAPPAASPRPARGPGRAPPPRMSPERLRGGRPRTANTAPTSPPTSAASSAAVIRPGRAHRCNQRPFVVGRRAAVRSRRLRRGRRRAPRANARTIHCGWACTTSRCPTGSGSQAERHPAPASRRGRCSDEARA